jgi:hypothetical protein
MGSNVGCSASGVGQFLLRTVNGNGNSLVEGIAIGANERWDLSKFVELEVLWRESLLRLSLDNLEFDVVGLGYGQNGR